MGSPYLVPAARLRVRKLVLSTVVGNRDLLHDIDFELAPRERLAVVGESGSGKTLLGRTLAGVLPDKLRVRSGEIDLEFVDSEKSGDDSAEAAACKCLTMVPQIAASALPPLLTPLDLVGKVLRWTESVPDREVPAKTVSFLERVGFARDAPALHKRPFQLSGGMAQRVAIAAALATSPSILVLDEPTTGLDPIAREAIFELLLSLNEKEGVSLLLTTHDILLAADLCPRFIVLRAGRVVGVGSPELLVHTKDRYLCDLLHPLTRRVEQPSHSKDELFSGGV